MVDNVVVLPGDKLTPSQGALHLYCAFALILRHKIIGLLVEPLSNSGSQPPLYWKAIIGGNWPD